MTATPTYAHGGECRRGLIRDLSTGQNDVSSDHGRPAASRRSTLSISTPMTLQALTGKAISRAKTTKLLCLVSIRVRINDLHGLIFQ